MKKLSRNEMKNVLGGLTAPAPGGGGIDDGTCSGSCDYQWTDAQNKKHTTSGSCSKTAQGNCYCSNGVGSCS